MLRKYLSWRYKRRTTFSFNQRRNETPHFNYTNDEKLFLGTTTIPNHLRAHLVKVLTLPILGLTKPIFIYIESFFCNHNSKPLKEKLFLKLDLAKIYRLLFSKIRSRNWKVCSQLSLITNYLKWKSIIIKTFWKPFFSMW